MFITRPKPVKISKMFSVGVRSSISKKYQYAITQKGIAIMTA